MHNLTYIQHGTNHVYKARKIDTNLYELLDESTGATSRINQHKLKTGFRFDRKNSKIGSFGTGKRSKHDHIFRVKHESDRAY